MANGRADGPLSRVLEAAEAASPVESVEAVTRELGLALNASSASFLVADLSGRAMVRLAHVPLQSLADSDAAIPDSNGERRDAGESATTIPFDSGPEEQVVRTQRVQILEPAQGSAACPGLWRVLAPVTERGEVIGLLELCLPTAPGDDTVAEIAQLPRPELAWRRPARWGAR